MSSEAWKVPQTEEGLQQILLRLAECRKTGDDVEVGNGLLALSFQVKWVRSDTDAGPFERSHQLALEALEAFRRANDVNGQIRALVAASAFADPATSVIFLSKAESLARKTHSEDLLATVLAARARRLALSDRVEACEMHKRALEIFRRTGNRRGQAQSLFSLSIGEGSDPEKRDNALEAAQLYRELGDPTHASMCIWLAIMSAEKIQDLCELEDLAKEGLSYALEAENRSKEGYFYNKLALIAASKGEVDEAKKYRRWAAEIQDADGLTPLERWEHNIAMTKSMIAALKLQGNEEAENMFGAELRRLEASKPPDE